MTSVKLREYSHAISAWDVYPRVKYFIHHLKDTLPRFKKIVENVPLKELFPCGNIVEKVERFVSLLAKPLEVVVLGQEDLKPESFVFDETLLKEELQKEHKIDTDGRDTGIKVTICSIAVGALEGRDAESIVGQISEAAKLVKKSSLLIFVKCRKEKYSDEQLQNFRKEITRRLYKMVGKTPAEGNICFDLNDKELSKRVSAVLETRCLCYFLRMKNVLSSFSRAGRTPQEKQYDVLETQEFLNTVQGFLRNGLGFVDMLQDGGDTPFMDLILKKLAVVVRCSLVDQVASKYVLSQDICNKLANKMDFEKEMKSNITKNTRYHLSKLEEHCRECLKATKAKDSYYQFPGYKFTFIAYSIREDIKPAVAAMEKTLEVHCHYLRRVGRLIFEIDGFVSQSLADIDSTEKIQPLPAVTDSMRQKLFKLEGVFGMGFVYGEFEIHLDKNAKKEELGPQIRAILKSENFYHPYRLRYVIKLPVYLTLRPGTQIRINDPDRQFGTLGCFLRSRCENGKSKEGKIYATTCAHVVRTANRSEQDVHHVPVGLFARTCPNLIIPLEEDEDAPVDIAALDVFEHRKPLCVTHFRDENERDGNAKIYSEPQKDLEALSIFKDGARSGRTTGIVVTAEYFSKSSRGSDCCFVLIGKKESGEEEEAISALSSQLSGQVPDNGEQAIQDNTPYAVHEDSGAINCLQNIDSDCKQFPVKAVSMIHKGHFVVEGHPDPFCLSFMLHTGICHLNERCGTELELYTNTEQP